MAARRRTVGETVDVCDGVCVPVLVDVWLRVCVPEPVDDELGVTVTFAETVAVTLAVPLIVLVVLGVHCKGEEGKLSGNVARRGSICLHLYAL